MVVIFKMLGLLEHFYSGHAVISKDLIFAVDGSHDLRGLVTIIGIALGDEINVMATFDEYVDNVGHRDEMAHLGYGNACDFERFRSIHF